MAIEDQQAFELFLKQLAGREPNLYFFKDHHQNKIDLLYPAGRSHIPAEIKSSRTFREDFLKNIKYFQRLAPETKEGMLIYDGDPEIDIEGVKVRNFRNAF